MLFRRPPKVPPPRPPDLPFDDAARDALGAATEEARRMNVGAVHAEHVLLALLRDPEGLASRALRRLDFDPGELAGRTEQAAPHRAWAVRAPVLPFDDDVKGAIEFSMREARAAGRTRVGAGELLLGLLQSPRGVPLRVGAHLGITPVALRAALKAEDREDADG